MARIIVLGAGIGGLGVALFAGRAGHDVTLVERDDTPEPDDAHDAFEWDRSGAPQVRHSHAFLARLRNLLRDHHPDVLGALYEAGATPMDFIQMLPPGMDRSPMDGDDDLVAIACRRTTFEWVLRRTVLDEGSARLVHGRYITGVTTAADGASPDFAPTVNGVILDDDTRMAADVVVSAGGRRGRIDELFENPPAIGEECEDTGIIYFSRFFRLVDGAEMPPQSGPIGGDLGYLKFGVFPGDNRTFSVTLAALSSDTQMRRVLLDPDQFLAVAATIPLAALHVDPSVSRPFTEVNVMAGLVNRRRTFLDPQGRPVVHGFHAVGDAHTCTNPIYGRGCSLAMVQAQLLTSALSEHGLDHEARATAFETATNREVTPWYRAAVVQDQLNRGPNDAEGRTGGSSPAPATAPGATQREFMQQLLRDGLLPAMRVDPVVIRAFLRMFNLLEAPDSLINNSYVVNRVLAVYQQRDERNPEPPMGPNREELFSLLPQPE